MTSDMGVYAETVAILYHPSELDNHATRGLWAREFLLLAGCCIERCTELLILDIS